MPFDAARQIAQPTSAAGTMAPLLYILPTTPTEPDGLISAEVAALRMLGRPVIPVSLGATLPGPDARLAAEAAANGNASQAVRINARTPFGLARATRLAMAQRAIPATEALRLGARLATLVRKHGCAGIHSATADLAATAALIGGRLAATPVSIAGRGAEIYAHPDDLALKLRAADVAVAACSEMASDFRDLAPEARVRAVDQGVDAAWFRRDTDIARNGRLLCIAPLVPHSGLETLLSALIALPPGQRPEVDVVGIGPLQDRLRIQALERGLAEQVRFLGARSRGWIAAEGQHYLGLVAPGIVAPDGDRDPAPVAVLQAMALELPVVASALMGLREIVQPECGHLVPPGQALPLARALRWLSIMPEDQRRRLGRAGRDRVLGGYTMANRAARLAQALPCQS